MPENPLSRINFTSGHDLAAQDVIANLTEAFGISDEDVFLAIPQLRDAGDRKYQFGLPPEGRDLSSVGLDGKTLMLSGTGLDPLGIFIVKTDTGIGVYTFRDFWKSFFGEPN